MVHGENRIPYWIDRRLTGLAGPDYDAIISFGLPIEPEDSQYGKSWIQDSQFLRSSVSSKYSLHVACRRSASEAHWACQSYALFLSEEHTQAI